MSEAIIYIVGDRFGNFAVNESVMSLSVFMDMVYEKPDSLRGKYLVGCQGITKESVKMIRTALRHKNLEVSVELDTETDYLFEKKFVHKHKDYNVLLSRPQRVGPDSFKANLFIDERCAEISDHMTGQHIQGVVFSEAARQMFIGVTEAFLVPLEMIGKITYIFNRMEIEYLTFAFPLPIEIRYDILAMSIKRAGNIKSNVKVSFFQSGELVCSSSISFSTYHSDHISKVEAEKAIQSLKLASQARIQKVRPSLPVEDAADLAS